MPSISSRYLIALILIAPAAMSLKACQSPPAPPEAKTGSLVVIRNSDGQDWRIRVELAKTHKQQIKGLMWRWSLEKDAGMLFIYKDAKQRSFWMKNTRIPLDIIFIGPDQRIAGIVENAEPYTETSRSVPAASQWVLEVNGGQAGAHNLAVGDKVYFFGVED